MESLSTLITNYVNAAEDVAIDRHNYLEGHAVENERRLNVARVAVERRLDALRRLARERGGEPGAIMMDMIGLGGEVLEEDLLGEE